MTTVQPEKIDVVAGETYYWCTCGLAATQPFCDGAHKGSGKKSLMFKAETTGAVYLCTCKQTKNPPYCDGSHAHEC